MQTANTSTSVTHATHTSSNIFTKNEVELAFRNHGAFFESLAYDTTPAGMHYLVVHWDVPKLEANNYHVQIQGMEKQFSISLETLKKMPQVKMPVTFECAGNGRTLMQPRTWTSIPWDLQAFGTAEWTGTPLKNVLQLPGVMNSKAVQVLFTGHDQGVQGQEVHNYERALSVQDAMDDDVLLVYEMNGAPLLPQHGFPLRLIVPGWYGMTNVKWLSKISVLPYEADVYQMNKTYRLKQNPSELGAPVQRMVVRSLMMPPGIPDFALRYRMVQANSVIKIVGRAWAGKNAIAQVEITTNGGKSWNKTELAAPVGKYAWTAWSYEWHVPNTANQQVELQCRATDSQGNAQPLHSVWNTSGMVNNVVQRVPVYILDKIHHGVVVPKDIITKPMSPYEMAKHQSKM